MWASGKWWDQLYAACILHAVRHKRQRLRHNVLEIKDWPDNECNHKHSKEEWNPAKKSRDTWPAREESEYTAALSLSIAISTSWAAIRLGWASMKIKALPAPTLSGDREHWLDLDPRCMREWAMLPMALHLNLPGIQGKAPAWLPRRVNAQEWDRSANADKQAIVTDVVYLGSFKHYSQPRTKWESPFQVSTHGSTIDCWIKCINHIHSSKLVEHVHELQNKLLACECKVDQPCIADILICETYLDQMKRIHSRFSASDKEPQSHSREDDELQSTADIPTPKRHGMMARLIRAITVLTLSHGATPAAAVLSNPVIIVIGCANRGTRLREVLHLHQELNRQGLCWVPANSVYSRCSTSNHKRKNRPGVRADCVERQRSTMVQASPQESSKASLAGNHRPAPLVYQTANKGAHTKEEPLSERDSDDNSEPESS